MTYEEKYPNIAKLTALLNQQKHPRRTLRALISILEREGGVDHMTGADKVRRYIERTGVKFPAAYGMGMEELESLRGMGAFEALVLAFEYGRAKGFRYSKKVDGA